MADSDELAAAIKYQQAAHDSASAPVIEGANGAGGAAAVGQGKKEKKDKGAKKAAGKDKGDTAKGKASGAAQEVKQPFVNPTPKGAKKDLSHAMESGYDPTVVESAWSDWWEQQGYFTPDAKASLHTKDSQKFIMVIPPPNVTGNLHIGHTLTTAIEDSLTRWHRMRGDVTLWVPGTDHAGIATQAVVERQLAKTEGKTRHDYGREAFVDKVWQWKEEKGNTICYQLRRIGASVDWTREAFTMNDMLSKAVKEAFVRMFDAGLTYRATRLVSWCPFLKTALSDIEVDQEEINEPKHINIPGFSHRVEVGVLVHFCYPIEGQDGAMIEVATTRIETMLGDVAVAVHPDDERYKAYHGKRLRHPFIPDRSMVVVTDGELVDMTFGTGAVKITPAHDHNDFKCGKKHGLEFITIIDEKGYMNENAGPFKGQHRFECRFNIQQELEKMGLLRGKTPNPMRLGMCSRSGDIIEPLLVPQWYVDCKDMARRACEAVRTGELELIPAFHKVTWFNWLEDIRDWCVSRQLWWGHRIPAYKVVEPQLEGDDMWIAGRSAEEAKEKAAKALTDRGVNVEAGAIKLEQDQDVLDTWFSSGLFPFSVFGWPDNADNEDIAAFFPTTLLETGHDILFFWVARMVMMSLQLTNQLPFDKVYLHAMVRDAHGQKMSKSKGNVIDPIEVIEGITLEGLHQKLREGNLQEKEIKRAMDVQKKDFPQGIPQCGADALRYGLLAYTKQGRSVNLDINRVVGYRHFCNKLWNAVRFALLNFPRGFEAKGVRMADKRQWMDEWILHRLSMAAKATNESFESYMFAECVQATYNFWLYELCDVYLELLKPRLADAPSDSPQRTPDQIVALETLYTCLDCGLRLLHPLLPFVTEELYQRIPNSRHKSESIVVATYPQEVLAWDNMTIDEEMKVFQSVIRQLRSMAMTLEIPPKDTKSVAVYVRHRSDELSAFLSRRSDDIATLSKYGTVKVIEGGERDPEGCVRDVVSDQCDVFIDPKGTVNLQQTVEKIDKKLGNCQKSLDSYVKKTEMPNYVDKAPEDVRQTNTEKIAQLRDELKALEDAKANILKITHQGKIY
mmetsp:Transcript_13056/g.31187  ORF Transcript_13056/g.31187 Transcript_13056/m.31187 type:complete len:1073 (+) Transcript_13056:718-3936(+)